MTPGVVAETDLAGTLKSEYVFFDGERVARRDGATGTGGVFYYFSDHLKTASVITDSAGVIKAESDYYPWGGELKFVDNDANDYKFTGKKRDLETGLDYFGARYYSNGLGRWVSADWSATPIPVPYADFGDPQSLNLYGFVGGNPASKADPDGHCPFCIEEPIVELIMEHPQAAAAIATAAERTGEAVMKTAELGGKAVVNTVGVVLFLFSASQKTAPPSKDELPKDYGHTQETEHPPAPAPASDGAKKGGGKAYDDTPENRARIAQGKPPIGRDGKPVELHSPAQTHKDQLQEMTSTDHRGKGNFKKNHTNTGQQRSVVPKNQRAKDRRAHWKKVHEDKTKKE
jgi:RHS repeat-associated protein